MNANTLDNAANAIAEPVAPPRNSASFLVKSKDEIQTLLSKTCKTHTLLTVVFDGINKEFGSMILEMNTDRNYLVLDELYPRNGINFPLLNEKLLISTQLEGIELSFSGVVEAISEKDGDEYYKVAIPKKLYYRQQRETYRVPISISTPLSAALSTEDDVLIHAELRDISLGGLCARLTTPAGEFLTTGIEIPTCIIQTPEGKKIVSSLEIVRVEETQPLRNQKIGARFISLGKADRYELSRLIAKLDRENIKNIKRQRDG